MPLTDVARIAPSRLAEYASVPIAFRVTHRLVLPPLGHDGRVLLHAEPVREPYLKNYDALPGMSPTAWPSRFDIRDWGLLLASRHGNAVGGAAIVPSPAVVSGTSASENAATLWDLRVAPEHRRQGVGELLFRAAEQWAMRHGFRTLAVETQDVNVPACRFYERMGCRLLRYETGVYVDAPGEARLDWERRLEVDAEQGDVMSTSGLS